MPNVPRVGAIVAAVAVSVVYFQEVRQPAVASLAVAFQVVAFRGVAFQGAAAVVLQAVVFRALRVAEIVDRGVGPAVDSILPI